MRQTRLCELVLKFDDQITEKNNEGTGCRQRERALHKGLHCLLETGSATQKLERFSRKHHGLQTALRRIEHELADGRLTKLAYVLANGSTAHAAVRKSGATRSELQMLHRIARDATTPIGYYAGQRENFGSWRADLEKDEEQVVVTLDHRAAQEMIFSSLEAYNVPSGRGRPYTEVFGICIGHIRQPPLNSRPKHKATRHVTVAVCPTQIRAQATSASVWPNERSLKAQDEACKALFPNLEIVGDFHSHPYRTLRDLVSAKGWGYSRTDEASNPFWAEKLSNWGHSPFVAFIVAVARKGHAQKGGYFNRYGDHTHQVTVGDCQVVIGAYRILGNGRYSRKGISLNCSVMNMSP